MCLCLRRDIQDSCPRCFGVQESTRDGCFLGEPTRRRPVLLGLAPSVPTPRHSPPRPDPPGMSGFWHRRVGGQREQFSSGRTDPSASRLAGPRPAPPGPKSLVRVFEESSTTVVFDLSSPRPGHTTGGAGRDGAGRSGVGGAGQGGLGRRRVCSLWRQPTLLLSRESKTTVLDDSSEARTNEILCKPMEEQSPRLTTGLCAVNSRFICGLSASRRPLFVPGC